MKNNVFVRFVTDHLKISIGILYSTVVELPTKN